MEDTEFVQRLGKDQETNMGIASSIISKETQAHGQERGEPIPVHQTLLRRLGCLRGTLGGTVTLDTEKREPYKVGRAAAGQELSLVLTKL